MKIRLRQVAIAALILAVIEVSSRMVLAGIHDRTFPASLIAEDRYGHSNGLVTNSRGEVWGHEFRSDAFGGRAMQQGTDTARHYWLYLGDSVGEGVGVDDSSCAVSIAARAERLLGVVNLCHIGHSTCDQLEVLRHWSDTCRTIRRVTILYTLNDVYGRSNTDELPALRTPGITASIRAWSQDHVGTYRLLKLLALRDTDHYYRYDLGFYAEGDPRMGSMLGCVSELAALCKAKGIALDLVVLPYRSQLNFGVDPLPQRMMASACADREIPFTDVLPAFSLLEDPASLYLFADEIHLSEQGHAALARALLAR